MAEKDFYKTLSIEKSADAAAIKKAYRKMAMKYHPDQNKDDKAAEEKFKEVSEAYEILKDEQKRAAYDRYGAAAFENGGMGGGGMGGGAGAFSDIFEDMFGDFMGGQQGGRRSGPARGSDIQYSLQISLEDAYHGKESKIKIPVNDTCGECDGSGAQKGTSAKDCDSCGGAGRVRAQQGFFTVERTCPTCNGAGSTIKDPCKKCHGTGQKQTTKTLKIKIPAGVESGRRIRLTGEGEAGMRGGPRGDLYILIAVKPHEFFSRDGANLYCRIPIAMTKAALGTEIEVPTIGAKRAKVKIPAGTQNGQQFRLKAKGMSTLRSNMRGDMFIEIKVETPVKLDKKQQDLFRQLDKSISDGKNANKHSPESSSFFQKAKEFWEDIKD